MASLCPNIATDSLDSYHSALVLYKQLIGPYFFILHLILYNLCSPPARVGTHHQNLFEEVQQANLPHDGLKDKFFYSSGGNL